MSASNQHSRLIEDMRDAVAYAAGLDVAGWEPHMRYSEIAERFDVAARGLEEQLEAAQKALERILDLDGDYPLDSWWEVMKIARDAIASNPAMSRPEWATGEACVSKCVFCQSKNVWEIGNSAWRCADCGKGGPGVMVRATPNQEQSPAKEPDA